MLEKLGLDKTLEALQKDIDDNYVEEFIDEVKEEREDILRNKKKFKQNYIDSKRDQLIKLEKRIGDFSDYRDEEYQLELLKKSVRDLKPDDMENSVDKVVRKYTQLCAITINRANNLRIAFGSIFNDAYELLSKKDRILHTFNCADMNDIDSAIERKDLLWLRNTAMNIIWNDPSFASGEIEKFINILKKKIPDIFENEKEMPGEEKIDNPASWNQDYFAILTYWFRENFATSRLAYIKKVGRAVHKDYIYREDKDQKKQNSF